MLNWDNETSHTCQFAIVKTGDRYGVYPQMNSPKRDYQYRRTMLRALTEHRE